MANEENENENEDTMENRRDRAHDKLRAFCVQARALPAGGQLSRFKQFMVDFVDTMYEETTGEKFAPDAGKSGPQNPHEANLLQTQPVVMGSAPMVVSPTTGGGVQMIPPGGTPGAHVQLFGAGQRPEGAPSTAVGGSVPGARTINAPAGRDSMGGTVELLPPGVKPPTAPAAPELPQGGTLQSGAHGTATIIPPPPDKTEK